MWLYPLKTAVVAMVLLWFRKKYDELRVPLQGTAVGGSWKNMRVSYGLAVVVGLVGIVFCIGVDSFYRG